MTDKIPHSELLRLLDYDPETGIFRWKIDRSNKVKAGDIAGKTAKKNGYPEIGIQYSYYLAHRLAWFYAKGEWPIGPLDHRDGDKLNNRIDNLRLATVSQNAANKKACSTNQSGLKGVRLTRGGRWRSDIETSGRAYYLGIFDTKEQAHAAYFEAAKRLFGEFARAA